MIGRNTSFAGPPKNPNDRLLQSSVQSPETFIRAIRSQVKWDLQLLRNAFSLAAMNGQVRSIELAQGMRERGELPALNASNGFQFDPEWLILARRTRDTIDANERRIRLRNLKLQCKNLSDEDLQNLSIRQMRDVEIITTDDDDDDDDKASCRLPAAASTMKHLHGNRYDRHRRHDAVSHVLLSNDDTDAGAGTFLR